MTQLFLQDALVAELEQLLSGTWLENSVGDIRPVQVFPQDIPVRQNEEDAPLEPYVTVRLMNGEAASETAREEITVVFLICVCDENPNRQGYRDAMHIKNMMYKHFAENGIVGGKYQTLYPMRWETQTDDTHPYYFAGLEVTFDAPSIVKEVKI